MSSSVSKETAATSSTGTSKPTKTEQSLFEEDDDFEEFPTEGIKRVDFVRGHYLELFEHCSQLAISRLTYCFSLVTEPGSERWGRGIAYIYTQIINLLQQMLKLRSKKKNLSKVKALIHLPQISIYMHVDVIRPQTVYCDRFSMQIGMRGKRIVLINNCGKITGMMIMLRMTSPVSLGILIVHVYSLTDECSIHPA